MIQAEQTPRKESRITIDPSVIDENGLPRVILDWQFFEEDLLAIKQFTVRADRALRKAGLAQLKIIDDLYEDKPSFMQSLHDTYHQSGGALMGTSDRNGVVNQNLKVFGTENLYVAGSSTFRTGSGANSVFTALAFATRLAQHLTSNHEPT
jgi:choline dehydrogenase-like flavoprotein